MTKVVPMKSSQLNVAFVCGGLDRRLSIFVTVLCNAVVLERGIFESAVAAPERETEPSASSNCDTRVSGNGRTHQNAPNTAMTQRAGEPSESG